jgi:hypothetical protein
MGKDANGKDVEVFVEHVPYKDDSEINILFFPSFVTKKVPLSPRLAPVLASKNSYLDMTKLNKNVFTYKRMGKDANGKDVEVFVEHVPYTVSVFPHSFISKYIFI